MCQMLGLSYVVPTPWGKVWNIFRRRAESNPHGWGVAFGDSNGLAVVKEPVRADTSPLAAVFGRTTPPASVMIGHIRFLTRGRTALVNTHPFVVRVNDRDWAMVHNGSLHGYGYDARQQGETDSEAFFLRLTDQLFMVDSADPYTTAEVVAGEARRAGRCGKLNIILTDGKCLYVHTNAPGTLHRLQSPKGILFCTQPLNAQRGWLSVEPYRVHVYRAGEFIYRSNNYDFGGVARAKGKIVFPTYIQGAR
ncbi:MAG: class II glutamine amidotransferase [Bacillota bacterium]